MFTNRDILATEYRMEEMRHEAERNHLVHEALEARKAQRAELARLGYALPEEGLAGWEGNTLRLLSRVFRFAGQQLVQAGSWLEQRYGESKIRPAYAEGDCQ